MPAQFVTGYKKKDEGMSIEFKNKDASGKVLFDLNANTQELLITAEGQPVLLSKSDSDKLAEYLAARITGAAAAKVAAAVAPAAPGATGGGFG